MKYPTPEIAAGLTQLVAHINALMAQDWDKKGYTYAKAPTVEVESIGGTFARIVTMENRNDGTSKIYGVYCFVAMKDGSNKELGSFKEGDMFKAASYKKPAKHVRGSIYGDMSRCTPYGMEYLK